MYDRIEKVAKLWLTIMLFIAFFFILKEEELEALIFIFFAMLSGTVLLINEYKRPK